MEPSSVLRPPPMRSRQITPKVTVPSQRCQHRCCSAERANPVGGTASYRPVMNKGTQQSRALASRLSTPTAASEAAKRQPAMTRHIGDESHLRRTSASRARSNSRVDVARHDAGRIDQRGHEPRIVNGARNREGSYYCHCSCGGRTCAAQDNDWIATEIESILYEFEQYKEVMASLEKRVLNLLKFEVKPADRYETRGHHVRHSTMQPNQCLSSEGRSRRLMQNPVGPPDPGEGYDLPMRCQGAPPRRLVAPSVHVKRSGSGDVDPHCWLNDEDQEMNVYVRHKPEWEEDDPQVFQAFSQPADMSAEARKNQENMLQMTDPRCSTTADQRPDLRAHDKRVWHLQQARNLLQSLPTTEDAGNAATYSDERRPLKSSGSHATSTGGTGTTTGMYPDSGGLSNSTTKGKKTDTFPPAHPPYTKKSSGREGFDEAPRSRPPCLSRQATTQLEVPKHEGEMDKKQSTTAAPNAVSRSPGSPGSDTSASCFSGYFPVNEYGGSASKPNCVPPLGLESKTLPSSAWLSGEATQGETYGTT
eukprot:Blabericola_migrator_1__1120@NODE_1287_length_4891_cov_200_399668_g869_i0_p2_GENE_NODE_1287_length_4891_cov_200_399668_g869_i0NODE_1287_length_4891_cov_200_399668_g869_i0_p2_ORF_typecomplete_len533_score71_95_NODE_1287_length_4891_cov_200_399668_g869_i03201918